MAEQEKVIILKVGTTEAVKSVNDLKSNIKELKKTLGELEIGSDEYQSVLKELTVNQNALKDAMYATTGTMDDVVGAAKGLTSSYNSLVRQMSELKKEWRATNDEARRNEIGQQIDEINAKLKEMDSSVGNFGRNVGNYVSHWEGMPEITKDFGTAMRESMEAIEPTKQKFESIGKIASGVASGFAMVQGAAALFGVENENLQKTFVKLQAAMALAQGASGLGGLVEGLGRAKVAFQGLGDKVKTVSKAMGKTGWLAVILLVVSALATLYYWLKENKEKAEELEVSLEDQEDSLNRIGGAVGDAVGSFKLLQKSYTDLNTVADKAKWIEENRKEWEKLGLNINNVNDADEIFVRNSTAVIAALKARAKAEALTEQYKDAIIKAETEKLKVKKEYPSKSYSFASNPKFNGPSEFEPYYDRTIVSTRPQMSGIWKQKTDAASQAAIERIVQKNYDKAIAEIDATVTYWENLLDEAEAKALEAEAIVAGLVTPKKSGGNTGGDNTPDPATELANQYKETIRLLEAASKRKIELLDVERLKEEENAYKTINDKEKLQAELERIAEVYAGKEYDIEQEKLKKKLEILNKWKDETLTTEEEKLEIAEEIADLEVEIEKDKQERLTEIAKAANERRNKEVKSSGTTTTTEETPEEQAQKGLGLIDDFKQQVKTFNEEWESMNFTAKAAQIGNVVTQSLAGAGQILNQLADTYANEDEISKEEAKKIKNLRIAGATMDMLSGIVGAISSMAGAGPVGWALGAIQAGIIATTGAMNIANIKKTDVTGNSSGGGVSSVVPNVASYSSELPFNYTRNVTTASESANANATTKVVIVESDIVDAVNRVETRESEATF